MERSDSRIMNKVVEQSNNQKTNNQVDRFEID